MKKIKLFLLLSLLTLLSILVSCKQEAIAGDAIMISGQKVYTAQEVLQLVSNLEVKKQGVLSQNCRQVRELGGQDSATAEARCAPKEFPLNGGGRCYETLNGVIVGGVGMNLSVPFVSGWQIGCEESTLPKITLSEAVVTCCKS